MSGGEKVVGALVIVAVLALIAWVYGDPRCLVAECRIVVNR